MAASFFGVFGGGGGFWGGWLCEEHLKGPEKKAETRGASDTEKKKCIGNARIKSKPESSLSRQKFQPEGWHENSHKTKEKRKSCIGSVSVIFTKLREKRGGSA